MKLKELIIACLLPIEILSQASGWKTAEHAEVLQDYVKSSDWFTNTENYGVSLRYVSYEGHHATKVTETATGYYKKSKDCYISEVLGITTLQNKSYKIHVDSADNTITVTNPSTATPAAMSTDAFSKLLDEAVAVKKKRDANGIVYRIDLSNQMYEAFEFRLNNSGLVEYLIYYYAEQEGREYNEKRQEAVIRVKPRLEIYFSNYTVAYKQSVNAFSEKQFIAFAGKQIIPSGRYKNYEIRDFRIKKLQ